MVLKIRKYPDPALKKKAEEVKEITEDVRRLASDMLETMCASQGIGLAAPQVGISKRIIIAQLISGRSSEEKAANKPKILINPEITQKSKETEIGEEGCLSVPGPWLKIKRAKTVEVKALDENGKEVRISAEGLPSRILQHEIDHLNGILILNRVSIWQKLKRKMSKS